MKEKNTSRLKGFTSQLPQTVTEEHLKLPWSGSPENFRCYLCGHRFEVGDRWRFLLASHLGTINPLVCGFCDGPDVLERWVAHYKDAKQKYWWLDRKTL